MFNLFKKKDYRDVYGVDKDDIGKVICSNNNKNKINKKELDDGSFEKFVIKKFDEFSDRLENIDLKYEYYENVAGFKKSVNIDELEITIAYNQSLELISDEYFNAIHVLDKDNKVDLFIHIYADSWESCLNDIFITKMSVSLFKKTEDNNEYSLCRFIFTPGKETKLTGYVDLEFLKNAINYYYDIVYEYVRKNNKNTDDKIKKEVELLNIKYSKKNEGGDVNV